MNFEKALAGMQEGKKAKLPTWSGYWYWDAKKETIVMHTKDNKEFDIRKTAMVDYTIKNILSEEWLFADEGNTPVIGGTATFSFSDAIRHLKKGEKLTRSGWNGKGLFIVYQKGYPDGIPCNKNTADAWGMKEGELFKCNPYLQIRQADGSHSMWVPSIGDVLAEDWTFYMADGE